MGRKDKKVDSEPESDESEEYVVEKILDKRIVKGKVCLQQIILRKYCFYFVLHCDITSNAIRFDDVVR